MASRTPARWLAPLALLCAAGAVLLVISASDGSGGGSTATTAAITGSGSAATDAATTTTTTAAAGRGPRRYTVQPGDTLSSIADRTGVPLEAIERLNPDVDAQSLRAGQRIKLRP